MTRQEQLQKELAELKKEEEAKQIKAELDSMTLVGKCFASHKLSRYMTGKPAFSLEMIYIKDKKFNGLDAYEPYAYLCDRFSMSKNGREINIYSTELAGIGRRGSLPKYEISKEQFDYVFNYFIAHLEAGMDQMRHKFISEDYVSQGDHHSEQCAHEYLDKLEVPYIDMEGSSYTIKGEFSKLYELLRWNHHPFLFNSRLYKIGGTMWLDIVVAIRDEMVKNANLWGGSIMDRDAPRIMALTKFIDEQNCR